MLIEVEEIGVDELKFLLGDGFEDVFVVVGEEEELAASAALALDEVEHLAGVLLELERLVNWGQVVVLKQQLEDLRGVDDHGAVQNA